MRVCIGGTFDHIHLGHRLLLKTAVETAGKQGFVFIGIACGPLIANKKQIKPFDTRRKQVEQFLKNQRIHPKIQIEEIQTVYGPTLSVDFDAIIISPETKSTAENINVEREKRGLPPMKIIEIPFVLAKDGKPVSSTRIRRKEIDEEGNLIKKEKTGD